MKYGGKPKGIKLAVLIGGGPPKHDDGEGDEPKRRKLSDLVGGEEGAGEDDQTDEGAEPDRHMFVAAAREILDAVDSGDKEALADTLESLFEGAKE